MNEEENLEHEVIDRLRLLNELDFDRAYLDESYIDAMLKARNIILDLYQKEKEKNKLLIEGKFREVANKNSYIKDNYISKDKIREKIKDITEYYEKEVKPEMYHWGDFNAEEHYADVIARFNELLEE